MRRRVPLVEWADQINDTADDTNRRRRRTSNVSIVHHNYNPFVVQFYLSDAPASRQVSYNREASGHKRKRPRESATGLADGEQPASKRPTPPHNPPPTTTSRDDMMNHAESMFGHDSGNLTDQHFLMALVHHEKHSMSAQMLDTLRTLFSRRDRAASETDEAGSHIPRPITFDRSDHFSRQGGQYNEGYDRPIQGRDGQWEFASYGLGFGQEAGSAEAYAKLSYGNQELFPDVEFPTPQQLYDLGVPWSREPDNLVWVPDDERERLMGRRLPRHLTYRYRVRDEEGAQVVAGGNRKAESGAAEDGSGGSGAGDVALRDGATDADGRSRPTDSSGAGASSGAADGEDAGVSKVHDTEDVDQDARASKVDDRVDVDEDEVSAGPATEPVAPDSRAQATKTAPHQEPGTRSGSVALGAQQDASAQSQEGPEQAKKRKHSWRFAKDPSEGVPKQPIGVDRRPEDNPGAVLAGKRERRPPEIFGKVAVQASRPQRNAPGGTKSSVSSAGGKTAAAGSKGRERKQSTAKNKSALATAGNTTTDQPRRVSRAIKASPTKQNVYQQRTDSTSTTEKARPRIHQIILDRLGWWADHKGEEPWDDVQLRDDLEKPRKGSKMPADYEPDRLREYLLDMRKDGLVQLVPADPAWQLWRPTAIDGSVPVACPQPPRMEKASCSDTESQVLEMVTDLARARPSSRRTTVDEIMERLGRIEIALDREAVVGVLRRLQAGGLVTVYGHPAEDVVLSAGSTSGSRDRGGRAEDEEGDEKEDDNDEEEEEEDSE